MFITCLANFSILPSPFGKLSEIYQAEDAQHVNKALFLRLRCLNLLEYQVLSFQCQNSSLVKSCDGFFISC